MNPKSKQNVDLALGVLTLGDASYNLWAHLAFWKESEDKLCAAPDEWSLEEMRQCSKLLDRLWSSQ